MTCGLMQSARATTFWSESSFDCVSALRALRVECLMALGFNRQSRKFWDQSFWSFKCDLTFHYYVNSIYHASFFLLFSINI